MLACPECGAPWPEGTTCQEIFESFLALEFSDPAYGEVHLLTVACFMIQHGRYSDRALVWIQGLMRAFLEGKLMPKQLRELAAQDTGSNVRTWKVTRQPDEPPLPKVVWKMTIVDVATQYHDDAARYRALVREWARLTLEQLGSST